MRMRLAVSLMVVGMGLEGVAGAQEIDEKLMREVSMVREAVARSNEGLRQYLWVEETVVTVKGKEKSSTSLLCKYDSFGALQKVPVSAEEAAKGASAISKRPMVRKKAEGEDYIERAISMIASYVPPKPDHMDTLLRAGFAYMGQAVAGKAQIGFKRYLQDGDTLIFTYDTNSKALTGITVRSTLGSAKDVVTMDAVFAVLPDGTNHLAATTLTAPAKKIVVTTKNSSYQKVAK